MDVKINEFDALLEPALRGKKVQSYKTKNLVGPGENYGSVMVAIDVQLTDCEEELNLVAKMLPPTQMIRNIFNVQVSFKKEASLYCVIIPTLQDFQRECDCQEIIDFVPKYYGSRISLDPKTTQVDDDACLLLENIKFKGFDLADRFQGFDLKTAKSIINDLATFHAVPIALKITNPDRFHEKIMPFLQNTFNDESMSSERTNIIINDLIDCAKKNQDCLPYLEKLKSMLLRNAEYFKSMADEHEGIFATLIHNDLWVNNIMLSNNDGNYSKNIILDFQVMSYGNPGHDLLFFIYSSLSNEIISENYDGLINIYYEKFIQVLASLKVDTKEFTYDKLQEQLYKAATKLQLFHILYMLKPILTEKDQTKELKDLDESNFFLMEQKSDLFYSRAWFTILDFAKKGWL